MSVLIDDMAPNAFKVLQFIVLLKNKEGNPIQNGEALIHRAIQVFFNHISGRGLSWQLQEMGFFGRKKETHSQNKGKHILDDAQKCGWKRLEWFGESVQIHISFSLIYTEQLRKLEAKGFRGCRHHLAGDQSALRVFNLLSGLNAMHDISQCQLKKHRPYDIL